MGYDFEGLNNELLRDVEQLMGAWLPGGKQKGNEWTCGDLSGGTGRSCSVNMNTGEWADFSAGQKGGDLISLYAEIHKVDNGEAYRQLGGESEASLATAVAEAPPKPKPKPKNELKLGPPPSGTPAPTYAGAPSAVYVYRSAGGEPIHFIGRYDIEENGKVDKVYSPRTWSEAGNAWVKKAYPQPRPIYNLNRLVDRPNDPVLLVEGEKAADAVHRIAGGVYVVISWPGGSNAWKYVDWSPVHGRSITIWPDADEDGLKCAEGIASELLPRSKSIKIIDPAGQPKGWDGADAQEEGWKWKQLLEWAKPRARLVVKPPKPTEEPQPADGDTGQHFQGKSCFAIWEELGLEVTKQGTPVKNLLNATTALHNCQALKGRIWYDEFHDKVFTDWGGGRREWSDADTLLLTRYVQSELRLPFGDELVLKAVKLTAHDVTKNEPLEWLDSLVWDQTPRIAEVFTKAFGAEEGLYSFTCCENFFISMVARMARPGCKVDTMVILEGAQGTKKSSALEALAGTWFAEASESVNSKDFFLTLRGKIILEIGEMDAFNRAETTKIKQIISCRTDRYRKPYGREAQDFPRRCIFVGTTNDDHYLRDTTGARRFWPVKCQEIDLDQIRRDREQYFAEAYSKLKAGATWWEMPIELTEIEQEGRRQSDSWEEVVGEWIDDRGFKTTDPLTNKEILTDCLKIEVGKQELKHSMRLGKCMRSLGYKSVSRWCLTRKETIRQYEQVDGEMEKPPDPHF